VFLLVQYLHISLNPDRKKPILNPKIGEPVMQSLTEESNLFNKTVLGAITLDMVAVLFGGAVALLPVFFTRYFKGWFRGFGFKSSTSHWIF
jgi:hypothetical protein